MNNIQNFIHHIKVEREGELLSSITYSFESTNRDPDTIYKDLEKYFYGEKKEFTYNTSLQGTDFQKLVWKELAKIPYGTTITYKELATKIGKPKAVRAIANAVGKNPLFIVYPCHRVVASDGSLGGFAYGVEIKKQLLALEGIIY